MISQHYLLMGQGKFVEIGIFIIFMGNFMSQFYGMICVEHIDMHVESCRVYNQSKYRWI